MPKIIYKYDIAPMMYLELPADAQLLTVRVQNQLPRLWVLLDPYAPKIKREFAAIPTGREFDARHYHYIGSFFLDDQGLVFHFFEIKKPAAAAPVEG